MLEGACVILTMLVSINSSLNVVWDSGLRWFWSSLLLFFITPALFGSYICRALRLAVVFHPCAKRVLPWLIPVRGQRQSLVFRGAFLRMRSRRACYGHSVKSRRAAHSLFVFVGALQPLHRVALLLAARSILVLASLPGRPISQSREAVRPSGGPRTGTRGLCG